MSRQNIVEQIKKKHRQLIHTSVIIALGLSLSACSTLSMSDFGIGSSDTKTAASQNTQTPPQNPTALQRPTVSQAQTKEPGMWDRVSNWFSSEKKQQTAVKGNNLSVAQTPTGINASNASLRAAQDASRLNAPITSTQPVTNGPVNLANTQNTAPSQTVASQVKSPQNLAPNTPLTSRSNINRSGIKTATAPTVTAPTVAAPKITTPTNPPEKDTILGRIGNWFSSDKKTTVQTPQTPQTTQPRASLNGLNSVSPVKQTASNDVKALTPTQTLRLSRQTKTATSVSSQGLTPYVPNTTKTASIAGQAAKPSTVTPQKQVIRSAPKITSPKVAVKQLSPAKPQQVATSAPRKQAPTQVASKETTSYVVTPETYRASNTTTASINTASPQNTKSGLLKSAAPSASAYKFYFTPGSSRLAPHHIAQLKGLASQAIARQRDVVVLGTSNPGGEAGAGASPLALQNIATARAMEAARNLQKFGVPTNKIKMRIAQSTTPTEVGTGGNRTLATMSARRVEVSIQ